MKTFILKSPIWKSLFHHSPAILVIAALFLSPTASPAAIKEIIDIEPVWSGHPVGFTLLTDGDRQYAAYYDAERRMTLAMRPIDSKQWKTYKIPSKSDSPPRGRGAVTSTILGWDSHNFVTIDIDKTRNLHLSGNMHCNSILYFRTERPGDITSLRQITSMVGRNETACTYPHFMKGPDGELIFHYRDGGSGNGNEIYNAYDETTRQWRRMLSDGLTDGQGLRNAYMREPFLGPDGYYHMCWMWRDTPDCATNHDISHARSKDLQQWETAAGRPVSLPMTIETPGLIVDPSPPGGGLLNMGFSMGFDTKKRPIVSYHRYDKNGFNQAYNARFENDAWKIYQTSDWRHRWEFSGGGSIAGEITIGSVQAGADGVLTQSYSHKSEGSGVWTLDETTLKPTGARAPAPKTSLLPSAIHKTESKFPGMATRTESDKGRSNEPGIHYVMRWETLGANRDRARTGPLPEPSMLRVYKIKKD